MYACKIEEAADGGRGSSVSETWGTQSRFVARGFAANGGVDERKATPRLREDEAETPTATRWIALRMLAQPTLQRRFGVTSLVTEISWGVAAATPYPLMDTALPQQRPTCSIFMDL
jgi:hypothetical protein